MQLQWGVAWLSYLSHCTYYKLEVLIFLYLFWKGIVTAFFKKILNSAQVLVEFQLGFETVFLLRTE